MSRALDPRTWLLWGVAMSLPAMLGRNPYPLLAGLVVALTVRSSLSTGGEAGWGKLLKLATTFAVIGVLFNLVTYHGGDREFAVVPGWVPIAGGPLTLNAVVYGVLSGLALVLLVTIWSTIAQQINWSDAVRLTPPSLAGIAIAGSIAINLAPKTLEALGDIREAQAIRGFRARGPRDIVPFVTPLLTTGLERAVTQAEALESRGYGGPSKPVALKMTRLLALIVMLTLLASGGFLVSTGRGLIGLAALGGTVLIAMVLVRFGRDPNLAQTTRYRDVTLGRPDRLVMAVSLLAALGLLAISSLSESALRYEPYPAIAWPEPNLPIIAAIGCLMLPALLIPGKGGPR